MNLYIKSQYRPHLFEYLKQTYNLEITSDKKSFICPLCKENSASLYPNGVHGFYCVTPDCSFQGDIFDLIRKTKNPNFKDEDVADYLQHKFKIEVKDDTNEVIKMYAKNNFCLFPLEPGTKDPQKGFMWTEKEYNNPKIWKDWVERGYGLALRLGKVSKVLAIDIDSDKTYEQLKDLLGEDTLIQTTKRGKHWIFCYDEVFDNISHANLRNKGYDMEIRANNAYIAVAPTSAEGEIRKWNYKRIRKMPDNLRDFLVSLIKQDVKSVDEEIQEAIDKEQLPIVDLSGQRNDTFVKTLGVFSKWMPSDTAYKVMSFLSNYWIDKPIPKQELNAMFRQIKKYRTYDKQDLANEVLERLKVIKEATAFQIAGSLKREQKDIEDVLKHLEDTNKIIDLGHRKYQILNEVEWTAEKNHMSIPIDFEMPFFHDFANFNDGGMLIIGSPTGRGKSHITGNFIKQLWEQKRITHLINTESDSGIGKITHKLNIPDEAYLVPKKFVKHPMDIELVDNAITVIDWLKMKEGDFTKTDNTFEHFANQLKVHKGFMIILTQIRTSNNEWFAPDQVRNYASLSAKYLWGNNGTDGENTCFVIDKIRDSKTGQQYITVPTYYNKDTKILEIRK